MPAHSRSNFLLTRALAQRQRPAAQRYPSAQRQRPAAQRYPSAQRQRPAAQRYPSAQRQRPAAQRYPSAQRQRPAAQRYPSAQRQRPAAQRYPSAQRQRPAAQRYPTVLALLCILALLAIAGCNAEPRKTDAELGLTPTQAIGRHLFDANCARCHEPYSSHGLHGPSLHNLHKKQYLPSGQPANDDRISEVIMRGRAKMPSFSGTLSQSDLDDLLAYLKTL